MGTRARIVFRHVRRHIITRRTGDFGFDTYTISRSRSVTAFQTSTTNSNGGAGYRLKNFLLLRMHTDILRVSFIRQIVRLELCGARTTLSHRCIKNLQDQKHSSIVYVVRLIENSKAFARAVSSTAKRLPMDGKFIFSIVFSFPSVFHAW